MATHTLVGIGPTRREPAQDFDDRLRITGGGVSHELAHADGVGRLLDEEEVVWVGRETVRLERSTGTDHSSGWQPVGGPRGAAVAGGRSLRDVGGAEANCRAEYESRAGAPLKVHFRIQAAQAGRYRVRWSLHGLRGELTQEGPYRLRLEEGDRFLSIDWLDAVVQRGEVVSLETGAEGAELVFGPFDLAAGEEITLDPTVAAGEIYMDPYSAEGSAPNARRLVRTSTGTLYAVYTKRSDLASDYQIRLSKSSDGGVTWTELAAVVSNVSGINDYPALAVDGSDRLHVVYYQGSDKQIYYSSSADGGSTWSTPYNVSGLSSTYEQGQPSVAVDSTGAVHVVWHGKNATYSAFQIWYAKHTTAWSAPARVNADGDTVGGGFKTHDQSFPAIAVGPSDALHVAWTGRGGSTSTSNYQQIWYLHYVGTPGLPALVSDGPGMDNGDSLGWPDRPPSLAVATSGTVHVVWHGLAAGYGNGNEQIWYNNSTGATPWTSLARLSTGTQMTGVYPSIGIDTQGDLHVVFNGGTPAQQGVFHAEYVQGDWSSSPACETLVSEQGRRPNVRWAYYPAFAGDLDWLWLGGAAFSYWTGSSEQSIVYASPANPKSQSFKALESRRLALVQLPFRKDLASDPDRTVTVEIYDADASGLPTGTAKGSTTAVLNWPDASYHTLQFDLGGLTSIALTAGSSYCIVAYPSAGTVWWRTDANGTYADGNWGYKDGTGWHANTSIDGCFFVVPYFDLNHDAEVVAEAADYQYDALDQPTVEIDALGNITTYSYDPDSRLTAQVDGRGYTTSFEYDAEGRRTAVVDARGYRWTSQYDDAGRLTAQVDPLVQTTSYDYYDDGLLRSRLDARGYRTTYLYDEAHRRTHIQYQDGSQVTFLYDPASNLTELRDSVGITTYSYDERNQVLSALYPVPQPAGSGYTGPITISYEYNEIGDRKTVTGADGGVTTYSYDSQGQLWWIQNQYGFRTTWLYDADHRPATLTHGNGTTARYSYDADRIVQLTNSAGTQALSSFTYDYDEASNPTVMRESVSGDRVTWSYDAANQLTREHRSGTNGYDLSYSYDAAGNRLTKVDSLSGVTASYTYDQAGQLSVKWNPTLRVTYSYDPNGNTTVENAGGNLTTYTWDYENRPTLVQLAAGGVTTATYAGDGKRRRYEDVSTEQLRDFYWDEENILFQKNLNGTTDRVYTSRPEQYGEVLSEGLAAPNHWFHHYDSQGSTAELTDPSQTTVVSYVYRAFGEPTVVSGSNPSRLTWLGKLGYYWQPNTSDYWVRARVYNPTNARWLSRDPIALPSCEMRPYLYVGNRPILQRDPSGLMGPALAGCLIGAGISLIGSWINHERAGKAVCRAIVNCALGALIGWLSLEVPRFAGCLAGAAGGVGQVAVGRICTWSPRHRGGPPPTRKQIICEAMDFVFDLLVGCTVGNVGHDVPHKIAGRGASWSMGNMLHQACTNFAG